MKKLVLVLSLCAQPALSQSCPPAPDHAVRTAELIEALRSGSAREAPVFSSALWVLWRDAPDQKAQDLLDQGIGHIGEQQFDKAKIVLDELVSYCPEFAEGYNQRAFAAFLSQDYAGALIDLDAAIALNPVHIAAISGRGLTLLGLGRKEDAYQAIRDALDLNPWLSERRFLPPDEGTDI